MKKKNPNISILLSFTQNTKTKLKEDEQMNYTGFGAEIRSLNMRPSWSVQKKNPTTVTSKLEKREEQITPM